jgi:hypothetical protein
MILVTVDILVKMIYDKIEEGHTTNKNSKTYRCAM